jgi:hypothetical protein
MLIFDQFGNLTPDKPIESTLEEFERIFVFNEHRKLLFNSFQSLYDEIAVLGVPIKMIWFDGSFVTQKINPGDIDIVLFVHFQDYQTHTQKLNELKKRFSGKVDCHFVQFYPEGHRRRFWYESDRIEFLYLFLTDRDKRKKGLIQINF